MLVLIGPSLFRRATGSEERSGIVPDDYAVSEDEILVAEVRIVQSLDADGDIHIYDLSRGSDGGDLEPAKQLELLEWARASVLAPMVYSMMQAFADDEDD